MKAELAAQFGDRGWGGAQDSDLRSECSAGGLQAADERFRCRLRRLLGWPSKDEPRDMPERRIVELAAMLHFILGEHRIVVPRGGLDRRVLGGECLHDNPPSTVPPTGSPRDLGDQLKCPLGRSEIGEMQSGVGIDHAHQQHIRKIEPFGDHLGAEQDINLPRPECRKHPLVTPPATHGVTVHSRHLGIGKPRLDLDFQLLRSQAAVADSVEATLRTPGGRGDGVVAVMADRLAAVAMMGQRHIAVGAGDHVPTRGALDRGREAASIEQQNRLTLFFECLLDRGVQGPANRAPRSIVANSQVDQLDVRHRSMVNPVGHADELGVAGLRRVPRLQ